MMLRPGILAARPPSQIARGPYRYLIVIFSGPSGSPNFAVLDVLWGHDTDWYPADSMTSDSAPAPLRVVGNKDNSYLMYDYTSRGLVGSPTEGLAFVLDLGAGNEITPNVIGIGPYGSSPNPYNPQKFTCYGSNDDSCFGAGPGHDPKLVAAINGARKDLLGEFNPGLSGWQAGVYREFEFS